MCVCVFVCVTCASMARTREQVRKAGIVPRVVANEVIKGMRKKQKEAAAAARAIREAKAAQRIAKRKAKIAEAEAKAKNKRETKATAHALKNSKE